MISVDLLPSWVKERKKIRNVIILFVILLLIELAVVGMVQKQAQSVLADKQQELKNLEPAKQAADKVASELAETQGQIQPYKVRVQFAKDVMDFNKQWQTAIERVFPYISSEAVIKELDCDGTNIHFSGYASSLRQLVRFYLNLMRCPALQNIQVSDTRGLLSPSNWVELSDLLNNLLVKKDVPYSFTVSASLAQPVSKPQPPSAAAAAAGGGAAGGMPGMGGMTGMSGMPGGGMMPPMMGGGGAGMMPPGMGGSGGPGGGMMPPMMGGPGGNMGAPGGSKKS